MAKKKKRPTKKTPQRRTPPRRDDAALPPLPDRRFMEGRIWQSLGGMFGDRDDTALGRAQEVVYQAFGAEDPRQRIALAQQALDICPDCADAYVLLAEHAQNTKQAAELYEKAVAAGERALGQPAFEEEAGHFWGVLETRPYMRARLGLAQTLWAMGRRAEAVAHYQDMLRLNPNDNQGVRYVLAACLLSLNRNEDLARLLDQFPEEGAAAWAYTRALLAFREHGDTAETRQVLADAKKTNKYVPDYLLGRKPLPPHPPETIGIGDQNEAVDYVGANLAAWKTTPGAIAWLRAASAGTAKKRRKASRPQGPLPAVKQRLRGLPQDRGEVWQAGMRRLPIWVKVAGEEVHPWAILVTSPADDLVLAHELLEDQPTTDSLWDQLARAMDEPLGGEPRRPATVQVRKPQDAEALKPHLHEIGVECVRVDELDQWDAVFAALADHLVGGPQLPGLLDMPGIDPEQVGRFFDAAAEFYRQAPWQHVAGDSGIKVECARFQSGPWYAVVMGQTGLVFGLALYDDLNVLMQMRSEEATDEENARQTVALAVTYGDERELAVADLEAAEQYGWKVAGPEAYPCVLRKERGMTMRPPLAWELELLEGCLRAIPGFVTRHGSEEAATERMAVPVASGELTVVLSWAPEPGSAA